MSLFQPRLLVVGTAAAAVALPGQFVGRFTTPAELSESFNVVAPQPLKPLLMHHLLRQPDWRRSLVLVNWNEVAHQLKLPLSVLGARVTEFYPSVPRGSWPLGRVARTFPGQDGLVRVVEVNTRKGVYKRPVTKIVRLELDN
ncbi:putative ATP-dependent RNA helicase Dbp73D [Amphibalanus amphitrite]|uniref:Putative ATP-dependent RNA helicase Dbp73D n=1 Tax=Amphibalanus amphitrite TaxID=1232801 RepID=A0A6A4X2I5_AMPAM|nr:putative ATP-dependent RNA helicase Dbp73D [Amphibalanus amphitrite]